MRASAALALIPIIADVSATSYLRTTALVTTPQNTSALQCWQFDTPLTESTTPGTSGTLGFGLLKSAANISYTVLPPHFDGGLHRAPTLQFVLFTSGLAHITLPASPSEAYIVGSSGAGLIVAADTAGSGHYTRYPSNQATVAFQIPFVEAHVPGHHVVNATGPCADAGQVIEQS